MRVIDWIKKRFSKRSAVVGVESSTSSLSFLPVGGAKVSSPAEAMSLDAVYRCVDILSGTIASMPLELRRKNGEVYEYADGDPLNYIFSRQANPRQTFFVLLQNAIISVLLRGNAFIYPQRKPDGEVEALYLLDPNSVSYDIRKNVYTVFDATEHKETTIEAWELIHIKNKSLDGGYMGVSTIQYASRTLSISANADEETLAGFKDGNRLKGFLSGGGAVNGMGALQDKVVDAVAERIEGELNSDKAVIRLPGTVSFTPLTITPADAQLLESRKFGVYGICRFFGVHPDMVFNESGSGNYKASENSQITFLNQTLRPLLSQIEAEFSCKLIHGSKQVQLKRKISFDLLSLYSADLKSRAEYYKTSIEAGIMTPNEIRRMENRQPIEGGDVTYISCNVAPIDSAKIRGEAPIREKTATAE